MNDKLLSRAPVSNVMTPKDDYSPHNSGAITTVAAELGQIHLARGGAWHVVASQGNRNDYGIGTVQEVVFSPQLRTRFNRTDAFLAQFGLPRFFGERQFSPSHTAFESDHSGPIFLHNSEYGVAAMRRKVATAPLFLWMHNEFRAPLTQRETRKMLSRLDGIICVSQYIAETIRDVAGEGDWPLYVLHNGVNTETFAPPAGSEPRDEDGVPTIVFVGKLHRKKGPHLLVEAAEILAKSGREFKVRFIGSAKHGDPNSMNDYEAQMRQRTANLGNVIEWGGYRDRHAVAAEYARASIFCAPAIWDEPCGLTVSEGMASGCAVVTTRSGGIPEVAGESVLYFDRSSAESLADVLAKLIDDAKLRAEYGRKARERALLFSWEKQYDKLCDLLPFLAQG